MADGGNTSSLPPGQQLVSKYAPTNPQGQKRIKRLESVSPEGDINQAKAEPVEGTTSALQNEYTSLQVARADFGVTPDLPITKPAADTYYVNNGEQPWKANPNNSFVAPTDNRTSDPYFNPNANSQWRADPFKKGGTDFRRPGDPVITPPVDQNDPRFRPQVLPRQSVIPDQQYLPQDQQYIPGYVPPNAQFNPQYSPEYNPQFISNNGVPAYSGMGFNFTNNFYNVGERPPLTFTGGMNVIPRGTDNIPVIKINTAFPGQQSFFGVPLNRTTDGVVTNPTVITIPKGDNTLPAITLPVKTVPVAPVKFEPGVVPPVDSNGIIPIVSNEVITNPNLTGVVAAEQTKLVVVNPVVNTISSDLADPSKVASTETLTLPAAQTTNGVEVRPVTTTGDQTLIAQNAPTGLLPVDSNIPNTAVAVPIDQKTLLKADETRTNLYNETYRWSIFGPSVVAYGLGNALPRTTESISTVASKIGVNINPAINLSAKVRDPAGAIVGVTAYEMSRRGINWVTGNNDANPDSTLATMTVPAAVMAYRTLSPLATTKWLGKSIALTTVGATYIGDTVVNKVFPNSKDTVFGTHTAIDDVAMVSGLTAATYAPTPAVFSNMFTKPAYGNLFFKGALIAGSYVIGNGVEYLANKFWPGAKTIAADALNSLDADSTKRSGDSLATARQNFSRLSDVQWSAAQADYAKMKAESDAMTPAKDGWEKMAISDRKVLILAGAIGENYLNNGTQVTGQGNTFLGKGTDIDLNSKALVRLTEARNVAYRLIRKYNENVMPATINGTPVDKAAELASLTQEAQRLTGLIARIYAPHDYEKALPEFVKAANEKPADFFTNYVRYNSERAAADEQSLRSRGVWDNPDYREDRRVIAKTHGDKAYAILVLAQRALDVNAGREAVELLRGLPGSNDPTMNARSALNAAITHFKQLSDTNPADIENMNRLKALYERLNTQIKAKFPTIYPSNS